MEMNVHPNWQLYVDLGKKKKGKHGQPVLEGINSADNISIKKLNEVLANFMFCNKQKIVVIHLDILLNFIHYLVKMN